MTTTDLTPPTTSSLPVYAYGVSLHDADNNDVLSTIAGPDGPIFSFTIGNLVSVLGTSVAASDDVVAGVLSAIKTFVEGFDWNTYGATALSNASVPTPVTFHHVTVTQWDASTTDVTP